MLLQGARYGERHLAEAALVRVLTVSAVGLHVPGQLGALRAGVGTQLALVRFLAGVRSPVHRQVRAVLKYLPAILASIVPAAAFFLQERARQSLKRQGGRRRF